MRKRLLASLLALCMVFSMATGLASAVEEPPVPVEDVCLCKALCGEIPNEACTVCMADPSACMGMAAGMDNCTGLPDCPAAVHQEDCLSQLLMEPEKELCTGDGNCQAAEHSATCPMNPANQLAPFAVGNEIYVAQASVGSGDGATAENAMAFDTAMADAQDGDVFLIVGTIEKSSWETPAADITIKGAEPDAVLRIFGQGPYEEDKVWVSMQGALTIEDLNFEIGHYQYIGANGPNGPGIPTYLYANGYALVIEESVAIKTIDPKQSKSPFYIFGGGAPGTVIEGDTSITLKMSVNADEADRVKDQIYVYGGGHNSTVNGNTSIVMEGGEDTRAFLMCGGGLAEGTDEIAKVTGNTSIHISGGSWVGNLNSNGSYTEDSFRLAGGGHAVEGGTSIVEGTTNLTISDITHALMDGICGGALNDATSKSVTTSSTGSTFITIINCTFSNKQHTICGGGFSEDFGNATTVVNGNTSLTITDSQFVNVYGGAYGVAAKVTGDVAIDVENCVGIEGVPTSTTGLYAGGWNEYSSQHISVEGSANLIVKNSNLLYIHTTGRNSTVAGAVTLTMIGGGAKGDAESYIYNCSDVPPVLSFNNVNPNATVNIVGDVTLTGIIGVTTTNIPAGSTLSQHKDGIPLFGKQGNGRSQDVNLEEGARLNLRYAAGENIISGDFKAEGTLYIPYNEKDYFGVGGTVTTGKNTRLETDDVQPGWIFLGSATSHIAGSTVFDFPQGETENPQVTVIDQPYVDSTVRHIWYLDVKPFTLKPLALTKYVTGDDTHESGDIENCFPEPRFEGLSDSAVIKVDGEVWNCADHDGQYPFTVKYYEMDGMTPILDDHQAGDYLAKVEPLSGYALSDITIDGLAVKTEDSILHIRRVSNASVVEEIDTVSNPVVTEEPAEPLKKATAIVPKDTTFLVNDLDGQLPSEGADIRLLYDEILPAAGDGADRTELLKSRLESLYPELAEDEIRHYEMKYLDLIDAADSNLWVSSTAGSVIHLPYPAGTDKDTVFALYHFMGLHRDNDQYLDDDSVEAAIASCDVEKVSITNTDAGICFEVGRNGFSPFALTWVNIYDVVFLDEDGSTFESIPTQEIKEGETAKQPISPEKEDYTFVGWFTKDADGNYADAWNFAEPVSQDTVLYARWEQNATLVTFLSGTYGIFENTSDPYQIEIGVKIGSSLLESQIPDVDADGGYVFIGWKDNSGSFYSTDDLLRLTIDDEVTFTAQYVREDTPPIVDPDPRPDPASDPDTEDQPEPDDGKEVPELLNGENHFAYVIGYPDGGAHPLDQISRAEVASIFFRLLRDDVRDRNLRYENDFTDVSVDAWYNCPVSTMAGLGILYGHDDGTFDPTAPITRAEFAAICARFDDSAPDRTVTFSDIDGHWAKEEIEHAAALGWINGYPDGSFQPDQYITRAEAMSMINRMLLRQPKNVDDLLAGMNVWYDNLDTSKWYYLDVQEATNSHDFVYYDGFYERWTRLTEDPDWSRYN